MPFTGKLKTWLVLLWAVVGGLSATLPVSAVAQSRQPIAEVKLLSGESISGRLVSMTADRVELAAEKGSRKLALSEIEYISFSSASPEARTVPLVRLVDGSQFPVAQLSLNDNLLDCKLSETDRVKINSRNVVGLSWRDEEGTAESFETIFTATDRDADALIVYREEAFNAIEGVVRMLDSSEVEFSVGDRTAKVNLEKLQALTFYHAVKREFDQPIAVCKLLDGGTLNLRKLAFGGSDLPAKVELVTQAGVSFEVSPDRISRIQFGTPSTARLSDLLPTTNDWRPLLASPFVVEQLRAFRLAKRNVGFDDLPLTLEWHDGTSQKRQTRKTYRSGFAMSGGGKLAFAIDRQYKRFQAKVGFAPSAHPAGHVTVTVTADGVELYNQAVAKRTMNLPLQLDLDVTNCQRLVIEVGYADGQSVGDQIHLVDTYLSR